MHARYEEWISFIFDHPVTDPEWHWASDAATFDASEEEYAILIEFNCHYPARVKEAMEVFLATGMPSGALRAYAEKARIGCIL